MLLELVGIAIRAGGLIMRANFGRIAAWPCERKGSAEGFPVPRKEESPCSGQPGKWNTGLPKRNRSSAGLKMVRRPDVEGRGKKPRTPKSLVPLLQRVDNKQESADVEGREGKTVHSCSYHPGVSRKCLYRKELFLNEGISGKGKGGCGLAGENKTPQKTRGSPET